MEVKLIALGEVVTSPIYRTRLFIDKYSEMISDGKAYTMWYI